MTERLPDILTEVELIWREERIEYWLRFGHAALEQIIDSHRRILVFGPNAVLAYVRWVSNDFGTVVSRIDILRTVRPGEAYTTLPFVRPGGEIFLHVSGWPKVEQVLQAISAIENIGIDPANVAPDHWRHVHNRLAAGEEPRAYTRQQHLAWLQRKGLVR
jgi:hypothetical protein